MKILVVTGYLAEQTVKNAVNSGADVLVLDTDIAAFITPNKLLQVMEKRKLKDKYDIVFVPGIVSGDFTKVEMEMGCSVYLGPKHAYDLDFVIPSAENFKFSKVKPACELLSDVRRKKAIEQIQNIEDNSTSAFKVGELKIGGNSRMKVMGEVVNATGMDGLTLKNRILSFIDKGADIIDIGVSMDATPEEVINAVEIAKGISSVPLSIDTLDSELISSALDSGIDIVLSLDGSNIEDVGYKVAENDVSAVVIPDVGVDEDRRLESLIKNIKSVMEMGVTHVIADPVLDSIGYGIDKSINRYKKVCDMYPEVPLFFGAGNVTELIDADSVGINASLTGIANDLGASILFTPELSDKTQDSISELKTSSYMMALASERKTPPKDLGLDLLVLKEKRRHPDSTVPDNFLQAKESGSWQLDPVGCFRIKIATNLNYSERCIVVEHEKTCIVGKTANEILDTILDMELVSTLEHAGYLGRELKKAELALKFNRSYSQDDEF
ncbi:dihydropteroate synthase-related protein [Methanohalobium evestigatum Z-7303]|uniref:Dihydropteroate synthase-related protein n=1 Tax=Methanohalobium evestigatum (strain ATCC BAA-1072 / DSM 3721 / NBRC 107634 / OCM 161 / Z-7303) TaxID=644295 RepID=D7E9Y0_METEZ|nr:dihydropteroate synthase-like protein [Methanohalobium evestigatum]ADI74402.1 dihydropteroate synthase-related protein [Methanohalobium evestigatum Z-7303]